MGPSATPLSEEQSPILVLGGTGTVGSRIAQQLVARSIPVLVASRSGLGARSTGFSSSGDMSKDTKNSSGTEGKDNNGGVVFDWNDRSTWENPFVRSKTKAIADSSIPDEGRNNIKSVYLIAPPSLDAASIMMDFVDVARARGARRFVLQSASTIESGGPVMGKVHAYLRELGTRGEVEWAVLRPTWFQQNLAEQEPHIQSIRNESKLYSAAGDGRIPWVSADDIAAVAVQTLTQQDPPNTEFLVLGPELLSYDDLATILSDLLGRKIVHIELSSAEFSKRHQSFGMPENYANMMSSLDTAIKFGAENRTNDVVFSITGVAPRPFREYAELVKRVWEPITVS